MPAAAHESIIGGATIGCGTKTLARAALQSIHGCRRSAAGWARDSSPVVPPNLHLGEYTGLGLAGLRFWAAEEGEGTQSGFELVARIVWPKMLYRRQPRGLADVGPVTDIEACAPQVSHGALSLSFSRRGASNQGKLHAVCATRHQATASDPIINKTDRGGGLPFKGT